MKLNEDRSKALFYELGLPVPPGLLLRPEDLGSVRISPPFPSPWMLKSLVLAGGRGKAGGIRKVSDLEQLHEVAGALFSLTIKGESVRLLRLEPMIPVQREIYLSFDLHRTRKRLLFTVGKEGGTAIEEMGPENLLVQAIRPGQDPSDYQVRTAFFHLGLDKSALAGLSADRPVSGSCRNGLRAPACRNQPPCGHC
jgi:succinyl-CoA synthetase alpha subunit